MGRESLLLNGTGRGIVPDLLNFARARAHILGRQITSWGAGETSHGGALNKRYLKRYTKGT